MSFFMPMPPPLPLLYGKTILQKWIKWDCFQVASLQQQQQQYTRTYVDAACYNFCLITRNFSNDTS